MDLPIGQLIYKNNYSSSITWNNSLINSIGNGFMGKRSHITEAIDLFESNSEKKRLKSETKMAKFRHKLLIMIITKLLIHYNYYGVNR